MSDLRLWMQKWSDEGEKMLARVQSIDKFDNNVIVFDYPDDKFRSIEDRCTRSGPAQNDIQRTTENSAANKTKHGMQ